MITAPSMYETLLYGSRRFIAVNRVVKAVLVRPHIVNRNPGIQIFRVDYPRRVTGNDSRFKLPQAPASASRDIPNLTHRGLVDRFLEFHHNWTRMAGAI